MKYDNRKRGLLAGITRRLSTDHAIATLEVAGYAVSQLEGIQWNAFIDPDIDEPYAALSGQRYGRSVLELDEVEEVLRKACPTLLLYRGDVALYTASTSAAMEWVAKKVQESDAMAKLAAEQERERVKAAMREKARIRALLLRATVDDLERLVDEAGL